jgi:HEAT repeat protein
MTDINTIMYLIKELVGEPNDRTRARTLLLQMGESVIEPLIATMLGQDSKTALEAARLLGELADPQALDALFAALASPSPLLGWEALKSILRYPADKTLLRLAETMDDYPLMTQQNIILALREHKDRRVVPALVQQMNTSESSSLRYAIIQTLGILGDSRAIPAIRAHENDPDHHVREWVTVALRQLSSSDQ